MSLFACVCVCVCACVLTCACLHACALVCVRAWMRVCTCVCLCVHVIVCVCAPVCVRACMLVHVFVGQHTTTDSHTASLRGATEIYRSLIDTNINSALGLTSTQRLLSGRCPEHVPDSGCCRCDDLIGRLPGPAVCVLINPENRRSSGGRLTTSVRGSPPPSHRG